MMRYWNYLRGSLKSLRVAAGEVFHRHGATRHPGPARAPSTDSRQECPKAPHFLNFREASCCHDGQPQDSASDRTGQGDVAFDEHEWRLLL